MQPWSSNRVDACCAGLTRTDILVIFPLRIPLPLFLPRLFHRFFPSAEPATPAHARAVGKEEAVGDSTAIATSVDEKARTDTAVTASKGKDSRGSSGTDHIKRWHFVLGLETAPVIGWLLLLAATCIDGGVVRNGIVGGGGVRPYDIMTLFLSFVRSPDPLDVLCTCLKLQAKVNRPTLPSR